MAQESLGLLQGTVDVVILRTLSWTAMHGYGIARWISDRSEGALSVEDAALYQALHRLERKGLVESEWGMSEKNHRAKDSPARCPTDRAMRPPVGRRPRSRGSARSSSARRPTRR